MNNILTKLVATNKVHCPLGTVADYIPGLGCADKNLLGMAVGDKSGTIYGAGDVGVAFTAQSISKIMVLAYLLHLNKDEEVAEKIGLEPTGDRFNSLKQLDLDRSNKPFNPMINTGAITATSLIPGKDVTEKFTGLVTFIQRMLEMDELVFDEEIYAGERATGNKNWAIGYMLKENNLVSTDITETMELYFKQCSLLLRCTDLVKFGLLLLNNGTTRDGVALITPKQSRLLKGVMLSCGLYNGSGTFAAKVGVPTKSGVSGGLVAVSKNYGIGVFGPSLDGNGNSLAGLALLHDFVDLLSESLL